LKLGYILAQKIVLAAERVINMQQKHERTLPPFLAIYAKDSCAQDVQTLTPRVMQWSDDGVWILDLRTCLTFWTTKANSLGIDTVALIRMVLQCQFASEDSEQISIGEAAGYQGVLANSPWRAVLLLNYVRERNLGGLINFASAYAGNLRKELSWNAWWETAVSICNHFEKVNRRHFTRLAFQSQCAQMQRTIKRLGTSNPWELKQADSLAVGRRFGTALRDLWQWTWSDTDTDPSRGLSQNSEHLFTSGFPWQSYLQKEVPTITRHLDDPLLEWDFLEPLLQEDLCRICDLDSWDSREGVMRLEWRVVSYDLTILDIPVCFRHPHSLASERNSCFTTTTLQAYYSFNQAVKNTAGPYEEEGFSDPPSPVISWQLMISERLQLSNKIIDLFGTSATDSSALMDLENRLPIPLLGYDICNDWVPEDSYATSQDQDVRLDDINNKMAPSFYALARRRPLFLYPKPIFLDSHGASAAWRFLERIMTKWWNATDKQSAQRDYYQLTGADRRLMWVFKDLCGNWYIHGIFA
jgi:hypothetical protein